MVEGRERDDEGHAAQGQFVGGSRMLCTRCAVVIDGFVQEHGVAVLQVGLRVGYAGHVEHRLAFGLACTLLGGIGQRSQRLVAQGSTHGAANVEDADACHGLDATVDARGLDGVAATGM